jgi:hypothetical protein
MWKRLLTTRSPLGERFSITTFETRWLVSQSGRLTRQLASGTQRLKVFGVWNTSSESAFARAVFTWELVENLEIELGGGAFLGEGGPFLGLISDADFASARLRWFF